MCSLLTCPILFGRFSLFSNTFVCLNSSKRCLKFGERSSGTYMNLVNDNSTGWWYWRDIMLHHLTFLDELIGFKPKQSDKHSYFLAFSRNFNKEKLPLNFFFMKKWFRIFLELSIKPIMIAKSFGWVKQTRILELSKRLKFPINIWTYKYFLEHLQIN